MIKIYVFVVGVGLVCALVYFYGYGVGRARCRADVVASNAYVQAELIKKQGVINAESYSRGSSDIRGWLRAGYTIAE